MPHRPHFLALLGVALILLAPVGACGASEGIPPAGRA